MAELRGETAGLRGETADLRVAISDLRSQLTLRLGGAIAASTSILAAIGVLT